MTFALRLYRDTLPSGGASIDLPPMPRAIYALSGAVKIVSGGQAMSLGANSAWHGSGTATLRPGAGGGEALRWELTRAAATTATTGSAVLLEASLALDFSAAYLLRCDRVDFPPGGVAYLHTHRGPGIRCLLHGSLRVDTKGHAQAIEPGGAWFEAGPDPVYAAAAQDRDTAFVRVMILPAELRGQSSIRYAREEDQAKPKVQRYQVLLDEPIQLPR